MNVLYDGWSLIYDPCSPAALHLTTLLSSCPPEVQAYVALPGDRPDFLPKHAIDHVRPTRDTPAGRLQWNQLILPRLAGEAEASLIHHFTLNLPLVNRLNSVASPAIWWRDGTQGDWNGTRDAGERPGILDRLNEALGQGGMSRALGLFWPTDLPLPTGRIASVPVFRLPPPAPQGFFPSSEGHTANFADDSGEMDLPESYVLYHGPHQPGDLRRLLNAWSWAAGAIGEAHPLVILGLNGPAQVILNQLLAGFEYSRTIRALPNLTQTSVPEVYRRCAALFHPAPLSPWGSPVRYAIFAEKPVVAADGWLTDALVGPAAFLAAEADTRTLGAALITVFVEDRVTEQLITTARQRSMGWRNQDFPAAIGTAYRKMIEIG